MTFENIWNSPLKQITRNKINIIFIFFFKSDLLPYFIVFFLSKAKL